MDPLGKDPDAVSDIEAYFEVDWFARRVPLRIP